MQASLSRHARLRGGLIVLVCLWLAACGSAPRGPGRDGPPDRVPSHLDKLPDPEPRIDPVRSGGPNKPYEVLGRSYTPQRGDPEMVEKGLASWYGKAFHGRRTSSGETYDMFALTAAHKTMPIPSYARVVNPANGRAVIVRVNDRGPFVKGRIIDLSYAAAVKLGVTRGVAPVEVTRITHEAIRTGRWRRDGGDERDDAQERSVAAVAPPSPEPAADVTLAGPAPSTSPSDAAVGVAAVPAGRGQAGSPAEAEPESAMTPAARGFWLQLGAFNRYNGAVDFRRKVAQEMDDLAPLLAVFSERDMHRLQAGPYASRAEAQNAAESVRDALKLVPVIVERR